MPGTIDKPLIIEGEHDLPLPGWDKASFWGLDRMAATYGLYAQLWRNSDDTTEPPRHWLMYHKTLEDLGYAIVAATGCNETAVAKAIIAGVQELKREQGID